MSDFPREGTSDVRGADAQDVLSTHKVSSAPSCRASAKCSGADPRSSPTSVKTRPVPAAGHGQLPGNSLGHARVVGDRHALDIDLKHCPNCGG